MRFVMTLVLGATLAVPALAQQQGTAHRVPHHMAGQTPATPRETVNDKGPFTPEANRAYQGGGTVLEGAPGGPPPPASAATTR